MMKMGYRYSDRDLISLQDGEVQMKARRLARKGNAPIEPDRDDYEAIEFLSNHQMDTDDLQNEALDADDYNDRAYEAADNAVPANNYKAGMIYAELGLWDYEDMYGESMPTADPIEAIRTGIYQFAYNLILSESPDF